MDRFDFLFQQYLTNQASVEECLEFQELLRGDRYDERLKALIDQRLREANPDQDIPLIPAERVLKEVFKNGKTNQSAPNRNIRRLWLRVAVAAIIVLAVFIGQLYLGSDDTNQTLASAEKLLPGKNAATLTLSDGTLVRLDNNSKVQIKREQGITITKSANGQIAYHVIDQKKALGGHFNTLSTAKGENFKIYLADGTLVCLNALSSLSYPTDFSWSSKREVKLTGEGYFEVAKDKKHPFIVTSDRQAVEVLGTHFNIAAYPSGLVTKTTLIEGAVKVSPISGTAVTIKPGEQAIVDKRGQKVIRVATDDEIAWKNGFFTFNNESMEKIMTEISRWYNIKVEYADDSVRNIVLYGSFSKFEHFGTVVKTLERTKLVKFTINGNRVTLSRMN